MKLVRLLFVLVFLMALAACGGGGAQNVEQTTEATEEPPTATPNPEEAEDCDLPSLTGAATWEVIDSVVKGDITLFKVTTGTCRVKTQASYILKDASGTQLDVQIEVAAPEAGLEMLALKPGKKAYATAEWTNFCGQATGPFQLIISMDGFSGTEDVTVAGPGGTQMTTPPACTDEGAPSLLTIGYFQFR